MSEFQTPADTSTEENTPTENAENPSAENPTPAEAGEKPSETEKKGRQMSFSILEDGTIQAAFPGFDPLLLNPSEVPEQIQLAAIAEGLISRTRAYGSKLSDAERTSENLRKVTAQAFDNLRAGIWKVERTAGSGPEYTIEVEAALIFRQLKAASKGETCTDTLESVAAMWAGFTEDQKKQVKALPRYQQALAQVKARRALEKAEKLAKKADQAEADAPF